MPEEKSNPWNNRGDTLTVYLPDVRVRIVELMREGFTEVPLEEFLLLLQDSYRSHKEK